MFKFLRQYQKHILAVGVTLLMVAFLIQPTISMFRPDPVEQPIGSIEKLQWTIRDKRQAGAQLAILERLGIPLTHVRNRDDASLQWLLITHEARALGLWAADSEVDDLLNRLGRNDAHLAQVARDFGTTRDFIRGTVRNWVIIQQYIELIYGLGHLPLTPNQGSPSRVQMFEQAVVNQQLDQKIEMALQLAAAAGSPRLSPAVVQRFLHDQQTTAQVTFLQIPPDRYLSKIDEPDEAQLQALFDRHKGDLPGTGEPYGFGYRYPDRVKIEYITIPFDRVLQATQVDEADALDYYDTHPEEFTAPGPSPMDIGIGDELPLDPPAAEPLPYTQVRTQIIETLRSEQAEQTVTRMIKAAQSELLDHLRKHAEDAGGEPSPLALSDVSNQLQERFGILPDVYRREDAWQNRIDLSRLPGIGTSVLLSPRRMLFVDYALGVKPLLTDQSPAALTTLDLKVGAPSHPVQSFDGSRHLFRILAADPAHSPDSIDEVRSRVVKDARRAAGYQLLREEADIWIARAKEEGLINLATQLGIEPASPPAFPKRVIMQTGNRAVPFIQGVGRDEAFMQEVFDLVDQLVAASDLSLVPEAMRLKGVLVDKQQSLYLTRLDDATPMRHSLYILQAREPKFAALINDSFQSKDQDPLSVRALADRAGFTFAADDLETSEEEELTEQAQSDPDTPADSG